MTPSATEIAARFPPVDSGLLARGKKRRLVFKQEPLCASALDAAWLAELQLIKAFDLPKLFLRLLTKSQTSDFPMTLAKWFFDNSLVDYKGLEFYHQQGEFLRMLAQNPPSPP